MVGIILHTGKNGFNANRWSTFDEENIGQSFSIDDCSEFNETENDHTLLRYLEHFEMPPSYTLTD